MTSNNLKNNNWDFNFRVSGFFNFRDDIPDLQEGFYLHMVLYTSDT